MKASDGFKDVIKAYLDDRAAKDALFAEKYANEKKSVEDCCTYILNEVKKSGINAYAPEEIWGMAVHYYDEDDIDPGEPVKNVKVVAPSGSPQGGEKATRRQGETGRKGDKVTGKDGKVKGRKGDLRLRGNEGEKAQVENLRQAKEAKPVIVERSLFD